MTQKKILSFDIRKYLDEKKGIIDVSLNHYLPNRKEYPCTVHEAMRYSVFAGGKRLRPVLVLATAEIFKVKNDDVMPSACAFELIHTYSLIHDDLPCMDNDDYRRGKLTSHKVFGEATAVLAGDALLTLAFFLISQNIKVNKMESSRVLDVIREVSLAGGTFGLIGGQIVDMESEGKKASLPVLQYVHTHKTGALICAAVRTGAILSRAKENDLKALTKYAEYIGLAFQIKDDCLNVEGDEKKIGKKIGSDKTRKKMTYPALFGLKESHKRADELVDKAKESLSIFGKRAQVLVSLADYIVKRDK